MSEFEEVLMALVVFVLVCVVVGLLFALPTMWLLNWLVPILIPGAGSWSITWVQAWGVNILSNILFKGVTKRKGDD